MINLFIGPMFAGKTTILLSRKSRFEIGNKKVIIIKYINDKRYDENKVVTHSKYSDDAISTDTLHKVEDQIVDYDVVMIDEIQFFSDGAFYADKWANEGKIVECFGLNGDFERKPFEQISLLIPLSDKITHLTAIDKYNGKDASFTYRTVNSTEQQLIGGEDMYDALSRKNYIKFMDQKQNYLDNI